LLDEATVAVAYKKQDKQMGTEESEGNEGDAGFFASFVAFCLAGQWSRAAADIVID
jgi:hypothetical protein